MKHQVIHDIQTKEYYLYCEYRKKDKQYVFECYVKEPKGIRYNVGCYGNLPSIDYIVERTKELRYVSKRPYKAGQACDGSIGAPALYLYIQLCKAFALNPISLYNKSYDDYRMTQKRIANIQVFAEWQGVEVITTWNKKAITKVLDSLTAINHHSLRGITEATLIYLSHL